jgi:hypothetical protein
MTISRFWISGAIVIAFVLVAGLVFAPVSASAQGTPTPTPTPGATATPIVVGGMTTSAWYDAMVIKVDDFFGGIVEWFDQAEEALANLTEVAVASFELVVSGETQIGEESYSIDELTAEIAEPVQQFFIFRCYVDSPLTTWVLIFLAWMVIVMLIKFGISMISFIMQVVDFVWGKAIDAWQSIPFT